jgi:acyl-CoA synthetase (AMP-forming)/AMP-acid ligase II
MSSSSPGPLVLAHWQSGGSAHARQTTTGGVLRTAAAHVPDRVALISGDRWWTYAGLLAEASNGARALLASFMPGDVVAVWAQNCPQWVALEFAAGLAGLTLVPVRPGASADEVARILAHSGARGIFLGSDDFPGTGESRASVLRSVEHLLPALRLRISLQEWEAVCAIGSLGLPETVAPLPEVNPDSLAQIVYTAGTTGRPKAALLTHRAVTNNARLALHAVGARDGDTIVSPCPLTRISGSGLMTLGIAQLIGTHVLMPRYDAGYQLALTEIHHGAVLAATPEMLRDLVSESARTMRDLSSLRVIAAGAGPVPPDLALAAEAAFGVPLVTALTQTEAGGVVTATSPDDALADRLAGVGRPLPGAEIRITSPHTGQTVSCDEVGEIRVRGYQVMTGYLNDPAATTAAIDADGWLRTGDLGVMDDRGYCRVVGRVRELIVHGGRSVYPREIETVLLGHPAVAEAAVLGAPDRFWGETVTAIVRLSAPLQEPAAALTEHCGTHLPAHKVPVRWLFVDRLPHSHNGKIRKALLSDRLAKASGADWQSWTSQAPSRLADVIASHDGPTDQSAPLAELPGFRIPVQVSRPQALEDSDF